MRMNLEQEIYQTPERLSDRELIDIARNVQSKIPSDWKRNLSLRIRENMRWCGYDVPDSIYEPSLIFTVEDLPGSIVKGKNGQISFNGYLMQVDKYGRVEINRKLGYMTRDQLEENLGPHILHEGGHKAAKAYGADFRQQQKDPGFEGMIHSQVADTTEKYKGPEYAIKVRQYSRYLNPKMDALLYH